jgi:hypothetical protein
MKQAALKLFDGCRQITKTMLHSDTSEICGLSVWNDLKLR